jgi:hypothetical protein
VAALSDTNLARGPPVATLATVAEVETLSSALAADIIMGAATAVVVPSARAGDQVGVAPVSDVYSARGPPSADYLLADASSPLASAPAALSTADLQSFAGLALAIWSDALAAQGLSVPTGTPSFLIADLADGILGQTDGSTITLDLDAAGHGWFVDATPRDASEFSLVLGTDHLGAAPGTAAAGAMDLLTVLLHEIGHWAGYDHDAGIALMAPVLGAGERVVLDLGDAAPVAGGSAQGPAEAALIASPTLDLSAGTNNAKTITIQVNANGTLNISGAAIDDNGTNVAGITNIIGNAAASITLVGPNLANVWTLNGPNSGTLKAGSLAPITFTYVDTITGGDKDDRVVVVNGATGLTSFNGEGGFDSVVDQAGVPGTNFIGVENFIDRPLLFIPGFGGTFADTTLHDTTLPENLWPDALEHWYLTRGIDPTKLVLDPLRNSYSDLDQT